MSTSYENEAFDGKEGRQGDGNHVKDPTDIDSLQSHSAKNPVKKFVLDNLLLLLSFIGIVLGFVIGFAVRPAHPSADAIMWLRFPGEIFLRILKMMIIPLIVCNVVSGTASLDPKANGKISGIAFVFIVLTNIFMCVVGIGLGLIIKPGGNLHESGGKAATSPLQTQDIFADLIRNIFPDNLIGATTYKAVTKYTKTTVIRQINTTTGLQNITDINMKRSLGLANGTNILGIIFASVMFGIATGTLKQKGRPFLEFFKSGADIVLVVMRWFLWFSPIGICSLIAASIASIVDMEATFIKLGWFVLAVTIAMAFHQLIFIPLVFLIFTRRNPFKLLAKCLRIWFLGFASTSTAVVIPDMCEVCEKYGVDKRVSRFVVPFSVTLSANGSGAFVCISALFMAQSSGLTLSAGQVVVIGILTAAAMMALPPVPSASVVIILIIITTVGIPTHNIFLIFAVEWYTDRIRTTSNGVSHTFCGAFTYLLTRKELTRVDEEAKAEEAERRYSLHADMNESVSRL